MAVEHKYLKLKNKNKDNIVKITAKKKNKTFKWLLIPFCFKWVGTQYAAYNKTYQLYNIEIENRNKIIHKKKYSYYPTSYICMYLKANVIQACTKDF